MKEPHLNHRGLETFLNNIDTSNLDSNKLAQFILPYEEKEDLFKAAVYSTLPIEELLIHFINIQFQVFNDIKYNFKQFLIDHYYLENIIGFNNIIFEEVFHFTFYIFDIELEIKLPNKTINNFLNEKLEQFTFLYFYNDLFTNYPFNKSFENNKLVLEFSPPLYSFFLF